ncbi:MAG: ClcB-like voltage-gated chloride channel protein [Chthoniobacterales bacterium]
MADSTPASHTRPTARLLRELKLRVWIAEKIRPSDLQVTLFWAGVIGFIGALVSHLFRLATEEVHWLLTQHTGEYARTFMELPLWRRLITPAIGGAIAGTIIFLGGRFRRSKYSTDYMEAVVVGEGVISIGSSIVKTLSAMFSIASGASIGREGPLVQLSSLCASLVGRWRDWSVPRKRLLVACGAAAGIASAYNAPIAGALFVAEIVLGTMAMEIFGPLVFASVIATLTTQRFAGSNPLYAASFELHNDWEILPYLALGILLGLAAPWFVRALRWSETAFGKIPLPVYARMALGGLIVGALTMVRPEVAGNGYSAIGNILQAQWLWSTLALVLAGKVIATAATFGSGAVGGVFTPTLMIGASAGFLFGTGVEYLFGVHATSSPSAFALVGMGAFLAATTHAPIMAMLMLFELTLDYHLILPLMLGCIVAYYVSVRIEPRSIYSESLKRKGASYFDERLADVRLAELVKPNPVAVLETAPFHEIGQDFITQRFNYLYVVDRQHRFKGAISLHDIKAYLNEPELANLVIARDIMREDFRTIDRDISVRGALDEFSHHDGERLPVVSDRTSRKLVGSLSKTDLILALSHRESEATQEK